MSDTNADRKSLLLISIYSFSLSLPPHSSIPLENFQTVIKNKMNGSLDIFVESRARERERKRNRESASTKSASSTRSLACRSTHELVCLDVYIHRHLSNVFSLSACRTIIIIIDLQVVFLLLRLLLLLLRLSPAPYDQRLIRSQRLVFFPLKNFPANTYEY